ncbi:dihydrofolate reductase family protein [Vibrio parahaemolyticus]|uniref:dihydrofolate reductase family protein n=1 Tax=Vibrio parahaemolyticus TaxID=670 RepID=UPI0009B01CE7|nr:dihydrofolate reductase family protein [Vibrio parahaemolyticus]
MAVQQARVRTQQYHDRSSTRLRRQSLFSKRRAKRVLADLNTKGFNELYIDGGVTIQNFLKEDLIDEMVITRFPILLGGGAPLFGDLQQPLNFKVTKSEVVLDTLVQTTYVRER